VAGLRGFPSWNWKPGRSWRIVAIVEAADEIPDKLPAKGAVLVGAPDRPKWLAFDCPCKTGHRIMVTLDRARYPHWTLYDAKKLTMFPSIDYGSPERRCHYLIRGGKIFWFKDKEKRRGRKR
jgi:Family of unknown function (DUF6527)